MNHVNSESQIGKLCKIQVDKKIYKYQLYDCGIGFNNTNTELNFSIVRREYGCFRFTLDDYEVGEVRSMRAVLPRVFSKV